MTSRRPRLRTPVLTIVAAAALLLGTLSTAPVAVAAAPAAPGGLTVTQPNDATSMLSWNPVAGATRYEVKVADKPVVPTVNTTYVPTMHLAEGATDWQVRAINAASEASAWTGGTFGNPVMAAPRPASPADGVTLSQPTEPPLLTWEASPGATLYTVTVDEDRDMVGALSYTTQTTSLVVPDPLPAGDWFWQVQASKGGGINSPSSPVTSFVVATLGAPTITYPPNSPDFEVQDVVLDWESVPGAKAYEVDIAANSDFTNLVDSKRTLGTRYSPPITLDNDQYYWRVRAVDLNGQSTPWTAAQFNFNRTWPDVPTPVFPADPGLETVPAPLYFQWTSVRHASEYEIQVGTQQNFSPNTYNSCRTAGTTYTPGLFAINTNGIPSTFREDEDCKPSPGVINYWRVRPLDRPFTKPGDIPGVQGIFSATQSFVYQPVSISSMAPSGFTTVDVPTLSWDPGVGAEQYDIAIFRSNGAQVATAKTYSTSYTLTGPTRLNSADGPFRWTIQATTTDGQKSLLYNNYFNVSGTIPSSPAPALTPLTGISTDPPRQDAPSMSWSPLAGAHHYSVNVGPAMATGQVWFAPNFGNLFGQSVPYSAMTDVSKQLLEPGTYDWQVTAYDAGNNVLGIGPEGRFSVGTINPVVGQALALDGRELDLNNPDSRTPCTPASGPCTVPSTPVLRWNPDPYASFYMVYVSRDASFTNLLEPSSAIPATTNTMYVPALSNDKHTYPDTEAGQALHWFIRPCRSLANCGPGPVSTSGQSQHSFLKISPPITGLGTSDPAGTEVTFSWDDYWDTNRAQTWAQTGELRPQTAQKYRIQVSTEQSLAGTLVDTQVVDQTTYTAVDRLYPEGTLYWRVQAIDSDENGLTWSSVRTLTKTSPQVELTSPGADQPVTGTAPFRWKAQAFATAYRIEVYKNNDSAFSPANQVFAKEVKTAAYAHNVPLPVSTQPYIWRVRRLDANGFPANPGPWSVLRRFTVSSDQLSLTSPADGGAQPPNGPVLTWASLTGASTYEVTVSSASGASVVFPTTTVATAYAPTVSFTTGTYIWKVVAKDSSGGTLATAQSTFVVDSRLVAVGPAQISAPTGTGVGQPLASTPPVWNQPDVTNTHQWLRDGSTIFGATEPTYTLTANDFGKAISLRVTGKRFGFADGLSESNVIGGTAGGALVATAPPTITGTPSVGSALFVTPGTWTGPPTSYKYQWLRNGAPIPAATSMSFTLTPEDAAKTISVTVLASKAGFNDGAATAVAVSVPKLKSTTSATLSASRVKVGKRVKIGITVAVAGVPAPNGKVRILDGRKKLKQLTLGPAAKGKITYKLPLLKEGKHKLKVQFLGNATISASKTPKIVLLMFR